MCHDDEGHTVKSAVPDGAFAPEEIRRWDHRAIHDFGIPGIVLMENAGAGAARLILDEAPRTCPPPYHIYCGPGNNGGDGFVVARHLHNHGQPVHLTVIGGRRGENQAPCAPYAADSDAAINFEIVRRMGLEVKMIDTGVPGSDPFAVAPDQGTIIDALFGTGLSRPIASPYRDWLVVLDGSPCPVIALDTPSGLDARSGEILGTCLPATLTITFAARKLGFDRKSGPGVTGRVEVVDIGIPREIWQGA